MLQSDLPRDESNQLAPEKISPELVKALHHFSQTHEHPFCDGSSPRMEIELKYSLLQHTLSFLNELQNNYCSHSCRQVSHFN